MTFKYTSYRYHTTTLCVWFAGMVRNKGKPIAQSWAESSCSRLQHTSWRSLINNSWYPSLYGLVWNKLSSVLISLRYFNHCLCSSKIITSPSFVFITVIALVLGSEYVCFWTKRCNSSDFTKRGKPLYIFII